jgi:hypothetical protein
VRTYCSNMSAHVCASIEGSRTASFFARKRFSALLMGCTVVFEVGIAFECLIATIAFEFSLPCNAISK